MENKTPALRSYIFCLELGSHISPITDPDKDKPVTIKLSELRVRAQPEQGSSTEQGEPGSKGDSEAGRQGPPTGHGLTALEQDDQSRAHDGNHRQLRSSGHQTGP